MDLLRISPRRWVNLDRLASVVDEAAEGESQPPRLVLVIGDERVSLDERESEMFLAFVGQNYRVRDLDPSHPSVHGEVEP